MTTEIFLENLQKAFAPEFHAYDFMVIVTLVMIIAFVVGIAVLKKNKDKEE